MDVASFCAASRVLIVAGKGGVGKTTMTAALARMAADGGLAVLVVELEGRPGIPAAFDAPSDRSIRSGTTRRRCTTQPGRSAPSRGRRLTPDDALLEYLADHGLQRVSKRLVSSGVIDVVATAIPGIRDVLVLGKVKQLEQDGVADLIVVDAPATGHAMTFLTSARGLLDAARSGPVRSQAEDVVALLSDPSRCRVVLVTLPEEMPVCETVEAGYQLEDRAGVQLGPVIVNGWDDLPGGLASGTADAAGSGRRPSRSATSWRPSRRPGGSGSIGTSWRPSRSSGSLASSRSRSCRPRPWRRRRSGRTRSACSPGPWPTASSGWRQSRRVDDRSDGT